MKHTITLKNSSTELVDGDVIHIGHDVIKIVDGLPRLVTTSVEHGNGLAVISWYTLTLALENPRSTWSRYNERIA